MGQPLGYRPLCHLGHADPLDVLASMKWSLFALLLTLLYRLAVTYGGGE